MDGWITNLDGIAFNPATLHLILPMFSELRRKQSVCVYRQLHAADHELVVARLTLARATDSFTTSSGTVERNLVTGVQTAPFPLSSEINTASNRLEWHMISKS